MPQLNCTKAYMHPLYVSCKTSIYGITTLMLHLMLGDLLNEQWGFDINYTAGESHMVLKILEG